FSCWRHLQCGRFSISNPLVRLVVTYHKNYQASLISCGILPSNRLRTASTYGQKRPSLPSCVLTNAMQPPTTDLVYSTHSKKPTTMLSSALRSHKALSQVPVASIT